MARPSFLAALSVLAATLGSAALFALPSHAAPPPALPLVAVAAVTPAAPITAPNPIRIDARTAVTPTANSSATVTAASSSPLAVTSPLSLTAPVTAAGLLTPGLPVTPLTTLPAVAAVSPVTNAQGALDGTIIANLSSLPAKFFVEGAVYTVLPRLSTGLDLPRPAEILMLYTCDAAAANPAAACFWDAYLLRQGGLYEVRPAASNEPNSGLMLATAEPPPDSEVWLQNRTGRTESIVFRDQVYELSPAVVQEFPVSPDAPAILYVRDCVEMNEQSVCEWSPKSLDPGVLYAMQETSTAGAEPGSTVTTIDVLPVLTGVANAPAAAAEADVVCTLQVPAINVRSGPGLQYDIVGKVRSTAQAPATLIVTGRSADLLWYTVAEDVASGGWVTSSSNFIACAGNVADLPEVEFTGSAITENPRPLPAATPVTAPDEPTPADSSSEPEASPLPAGAAEAEAPPPDAEDTPVPEPEPAEPAIPPGQALLVVNNGFMHDIRFTIDQRFRPQEGPSEYDLAPGDSIAVIVFPGQVAFTASSPWSGLSGNADIYVEPDVAIPLWLRFESEQDDSGSWNLAWQ